MTKEQLCLRKNIDAQINKRKDEIEKNLIEIQRLAVPELYDVGDVLTDAADITTMDGVEMNRVLSVYQNDERMTIALSNVWAISQSLKALESLKGMLKPFSGDGIDIKTPIKDCPLTVRTKNSCLTLGITTLEALINTPAKALVSSRYFGKHAYYEVLDFLSGCGLSLRMDGYESKTASETSEDT